MNALVFFSKKPLAQGPVQLDVPALGSPTITVEWKTHPAADCLIVMSRQSSPSLGSSWKTATLLRTRFRREGGMFGSAKADEVINNHIT